MNTWPENDVFLTHALLDPQLDKGKMRHEQPDPAIRHSKSSIAMTDGLVVNGIKRIATAAPYADEILVWPFPPTFQARVRPNTRTSLPFPMNTPGLKTLVPTLVRSARQRVATFHCRRSSMRSMLPWCSITCWFRGNGFSCTKRLEFLNRMYRDSRMREMTAHQTNSPPRSKTRFRLCACSCASPRPPDWTKSRTSWRCWAKPRSGWK